MINKNTLKFDNELVKYLIRESNLEDLNKLAVWIEDSENQSHFESYVRTYYLITLAMSDPNVEEIKKRLLKQIKEDKSPFRKPKFKKVLKYVALILILFSLGYGYNSFINRNFEKIPILIPNQESVILQLDDGNKLVLNLDEDNKPIKDSNGHLLGIQKKAQLIYYKNKNKTAYNTVYVPKAKTLSIVLSDSSTVFINADTTLKFPVTFHENDMRMVYLQNGEAFFDIKKKELKPFIVQIDSAKIKVLGTKFNVSNYPENKNSNTVLLEGSIEIVNTIEGYDKNVEPVLLQVGYMAQWNNDYSNISIKNVNTRTYTAWLEGKLVFRNASFFQIRKALERKFNIVIKSKNKNLDIQLFDATFDIEPINEILETFNKSFAIDYKIINNEVIIQ